MKYDRLDNGQLDDSMNSEFHVLIEIVHLFLIHIDYCFSSCEKRFFVMPYMNGGDLREILKRQKRLSEY